MGTGLADLRRRYEEDDPTLTEDEVAGLRHSVSTQVWFDLSAARFRRETERNRPMHIARAKTDFEIAQQYRDDAAKLLDAIIGLINKARQDGMVVNFQIGPPDAFNRQSLVMLEISKKLC